jgi:hypothetical protein
MTTTELDPPHLAAAPPELQLYTEPSPAHVPYRVPVARAFTDDERDELAEVLDISTSPYRDYWAFHAEVRRLIDDGRIPACLQEVCASARTWDVRRDPIVFLRNCPTGDVPYLDFENPLESKYERKRDFIAEAFMTVFAELHGSTVVTYRTANRGDFFHDVHPLKNLQFSKSQKSVNTLPFHTDLPDNKVRPDWANLLYLRSSERNEVYTAFVRLTDVVAALDADVLATLRKPLFRVPRTRTENDINVYGLAEEGFLEWKPIIIPDRGYEYFCFNECLTVADSREAQAAMAVLSNALQRIRHSISITERDFVACCNNTSMHARHVVRITDWNEHQHRWVLKTWNVEDVALHQQHFVPGRNNVVDE